MSRAIVRESIDRFFDYDLHVETRTIYLGDSTSDEEVGPVLAERVIKALHVLSLKPEEPIKIIMNSLGGCWYNGMAIFDAIRACPCRVTIEVLGSAMSMASVILQAADVRIIHPNATIMVHDGTDAYDGPSRNVERWGDQSKKLRQQMYEIYAKRSGRPVSFWEKKCAHDSILNAQEALEYGLVDKIFGEEEEQTGE